MERNRESRRASIVGSNGFSSRRHRTNSLRDSPDEDGGIELQESVRLRDRVKKDRDRERDFRERTTRSKRRRGERETSEESTNDEDHEDEENTASVTGVRFSPAASVSNHHHDGHLSNHRTSHGSSISQKHIKNNIGNNHHLQHRKSFPLGSSSSSSKVFRAAPVWRPGDEIISVSVPRKVRSASTKRSHDWMSNSTNNNSGGGAAAGAERNLRQASSSPARQGLASTSTPSSAPPAPMSPSSNPFSRNKLKPNGNNGGPKLKPPKASSKQSSSNPEELEIEIAEVLYGLMTQSQSPPSKKEDSKELDRSKSDSQIIGTSSNTLQSVATKRKKPRQVVENSSHVGPVSAKPEKDQMPCGVEMGVNSVISQGQPAQPPEPTSRKQDSELKTVVAEEELRDSKDFVGKEERESSTVKIEDNFCKDSTLIETAATIIKANSMVFDMETQREQKFELDLMDPLPSRARSSPEKTADADHKPVHSIPHASAAVAAAAAEGKIKSKVEECESNKENENKGMNINLQSDLPKAERNGNVGVVNAGNKLHEQQEMPLKANKEEPITTDKSGQPRSSSLPMGSWIPPMGYMAATLQGVVPKEGTSVTTPPPVQPLFSQTRPKRCTTHCYIARNIHSLQQFMKMNPLLQAAASASLFASKPSNPNNAHDKNHSPNNGVKDKSSQTASAATTSDSSQRKHQILVQQTLPHSNLLGPPFFLPFNQQQAAAAPPSSAMPNSAHETGRPASSNPPVSSAMSFNYPNEAQYLAILQNNGYPFPVGPPPNYRGATPALFNGSFYPTQMIHPSQIQHHQTQSNGGPASSQKQLLSQQQNNSGPANANVQNFQNEKKPQQQQQQQPSHGFAMSFGPINGANGGIDIASMAQNHAIFQGFPEATRQMMAAAASASAQAAQTKNLKMSEDGKSRHNNGDSAADDERKSSFAISSRSELANGPVSSSSSRPVTANQAQFQQLQQMAANFPNGFPQNLVQSSPQWKNSSQAPSTKNNNLPQQNSRPGTKLQNQISFGGNQKPSTPSHDHPMMASTNSKTGQNPSFSSQQSKNSQSILGNPKNMQQQAQIFFSSQFSQAQSPHSNTSSSNSGPTGFYMQRRRPDQQAQASTMTNDPAKAIAAAQFAAAGGTLLPAGFSYVQVKTAEQKQPAG